MRKIIRRVLIESFGAFPNQYKIAEICAERFEQMLNNGVTEDSVAINESIIKKVNLKISPEKHIVGQLAGAVFKDGVLFVEIGSNAIYKFNKDKIAYVIAHELMHGNVFLNRFKNLEDKTKTDDQPDEYEVLITILRNEDDNMAYKYAYALYSTYYQEVNAIVSQTCLCMEVDYRERGLDKITPQTFQILLRRSKPWEVFLDNIKECCDILDLYSNRMIQAEIVDVFKRYGLNTTIEDVRSRIKKVRAISNEALNKCIKNATFFWNELQKDGKIKQPTNFK